MIRFHPKEFRQRRPQGDGWAWQLDGVRRVLYRLPELRAADPQRTVFIVEGEKDVDALTARGLLAVCNPGGAGKWRAEYNAALAGRSVVILPDHDAPGLAHARQVAAALHGVAVAVRLVELPGLPDHGDVSDWLQGHSTDELTALAAAAPCWRGEAPAAGLGVPVGELRCESSIPWLWEGFLAPGEVTLFTALWKVGKTTFLAHLLRAVQTGEPFCGRRVQPGRVLYFSEETARQWVERRDQLGLGGGLHLVLRRFPVRPDLPAWVAFLQELAASLRHTPFDLVVFDTLASLWPVVNENDAAEVGAALRPLQQLGPQAAVLLVHHHRKSGGDEATASRGSGALPGMVDTIVEMRRPRGAERTTHRRLLVGYGRHGETPPETLVELSEAGYVVVETAEPPSPAERRREAVRAILPTAPPGWTAQQVHEALPTGVRPRLDKLRDELDAEAAAGRCRREGLGVRGSPATYWRAADPAAAGRDRAAPPPAEGGAASVSPASPGPSLFAGMLRDEALKNFLAHETGQVS